MLIQWRASSQRFVAMSSPSSGWDGRRGPGATLEIVEPTLHSGCRPLLPRPVAERITHRRVEESDEEVTNEA